MIGILKVLYRYLACLFLYSRNIKVKYNTKFNTKTKWGGITR